MHESLSMSSFSSPSGLVVGLFTGLSRFMMLAMKRIAQARGVCSALRTRCCTLCCRACCERHHSPSAPGHRRPYALSSASLAQPLTRFPTLCYNR